MAYLPCRCRKKGNIERTYGELKREYIRCKIYARCDIGSPVRPAATLEAFTEIPASGHTLFCFFGESIANLTEPKAGSITHYDQPSNKLKTI